MKNVCTSHSYFINSKYSSTECSIPNALFPTTFDNSLEMAKRQVRP